MDEAFLVGAAMGGLVGMLVGILLTTWALYWAFFGGGDEPEQEALAVIVEADEWGNVLLGGSEEETISSRAWRSELEGKPFGLLRPLIDLIFFWQPNHCENAYLAWKAGTSTPEP